MPGTFYYLGYDLVLFFSSVEMRAQIAWNEDVSISSSCTPRRLIAEHPLLTAQGIEKRSPAKIVYDPDITAD